MVIELHTHTHIYSKRFYKQVTRLGLGFCFRVDDFNALLHTTMPLKTRDPSVRCLHVNVASILSENNERSAFGNKAFKTVRVCRHEHEGIKFNISIFQMLLLFLIHHGLLPRCCWFRPYIAWQWCHPVACHHAKWILKCLVLGWKVQMVWGSSTFQSGYFWIVILRPSVFN